MKKTIKKLLLLMMAMLFMLAFVACGDEDDDDDDDKESKKVENKPKAVAEAYIKAYEKFDIDGMDKYSVCTLEEMHGDTEEFEAMKEGYEYSDDGISYKVSAKIDMKLNDEVDTDVDEIKAMIEDDSYFEGEIDYDKIDEVAAYELTISMSYTVDDLKVDEDELGMTKEEFKEEYGVSIQEYIEQTMKEAEAEYDAVLYLAKYDGDWKVIYED